MRKSSHQSKTLREREAYSKSIKKIDYEPTKDDSLDFPASDDSKADLSVSTVKQTRPPKLKERLSEHFKENWIAWAIVGLTAVLGFFVFTFNRDMGRAEGKLDVIQKGVESVQGDIKRIDDKVHTQDLLIQRNQIHIEELQKTNDRKTR